MPVFVFKHFCDEEKKKITSLVIYSIALTYEKAEKVFATVTLCLRESFCPKLHHTISSSELFVLIFQLRMLHM